MKIKLKFLIIFVVIVVFNKNIYSQEDRDHIVNLGIGGIVSINTDQDLILGLNTDYRFFFNDLFAFGGGLGYYSDTNDIIIPVSGRIDFVYGDVYIGLNGGFHIIKSNSTNNEFKIDYLAGIESGYFYELSKKLLAVVYGKFNISLYQNYFEGGLQLCLKF